jgi:hypothetical protein
MFANDFMKKTDKSGGLDKAKSIVHEYEAQLLCAKLLHTSFSSVLLRSQIEVMNDHIIINCDNRTIADIWCDKCQELCQIVLDAIRLPLRVLVCWPNCGSSNYDIPTGAILKMSLNNPGDTSRTLRVLQQVVSGLGDRDDRKLLDEVMDEDEARCLVELESDRPIICNSNLASLVQQTAAEWRRTDLRKHWAEKPAEFTDNKDDAPEYLVKVKDRLTKDGSVLLGYETWLTDDVFGNFRSLFQLTSFQGLAARAVTIYSFEESECLVSG